MRQLLPSHPGDDTNRAWFFFTLLSGVLVWLARAGSAWSRHRMQPSPMRRLPRTKTQPLSTRLPKVWQRPPRPEEPPHPPP